MSFEYKKITDASQAQAAIRAALVMAIGKGAITRKGFDHAMSAVDWIEKALQLSPAPAWQPIATAPKDGSKVDLWTTDRDGLSGRWADCEYDDDDDEWFFWGSDGIKVYLKSEDFSITHWQPLPAPPVGDCKLCEGTGEQIEFSYGAIPEHPEKVPCDICHGTGKAAEVTG